MKKALIKILFLTVFLSVSSNSIAVFSESEAAWEVRALPETIKTEKQKMGDYVPVEGAGVPIIEISAKAKADEYDSNDSWRDRLNFSFKARGRCDENYRLGDAKFVLGEGDLKINVNRNNRSFSANEGQAWKEYTIAVAYSDPAIGMTPEQACNTELDRRISAGVSKAGLLQNGFAIKFDKAYRGTFHMQCDHKSNIGFRESDDYRSDVYYPAYVHCQPSKYFETTGSSTPPRAKKVESRIKSVAIRATPEVWEDKQCPAFIALKGQIIAGDFFGEAQETIRWRFVGSDGFLSVWHDDTIAKTETKTVEFIRRIDTPAPRTILKRTSYPRVDGWVALEVHYDYMDNSSGQTVTNKLKSNFAEFTVHCPYQPTRVSP